MKKLIPTSALFLFSLNLTHRRIIGLAITLFIFFSHLSYSQSNTLSAGLWNTGTNWSAGVPTGATNANVNHSMTINTNITVSSGDYTINSSVNDLSGGTAYNLSVSGTGGNQGNFDVYATSLFEGTCTVNSNGTLTVRNGDTLTVGTATFANNSTVVVEAGGTLIINGNLTNNNNSTGISINGVLIVNGDFNGGNGSAITGTGSMSTTGTLITTGSGSVFGSTGDCNTGPCSGNNLCVSNTISAAQTICAGITPTGLTGNALAGYTYKWQISTTSATTGFSDIASVTSQNYAPGTLYTNTWYRRIATTIGCTAISAAVKITVNVNSWIGGTSTNWNTAANWCGGVPTSLTDVTIPSGTSFSPAITGVVSVKNLTVSTSATLSKTSTGTLNIYGNFVNNGTFTDNGIYTDGGSVVFIGSASQSISGSTTFNNLTINNSNGVSINNSITVNGILTLTAGTFTTNGNLNQNLYDGAIAGTGTGTTTGNIRFFKTIWGDKYHYLSSPISGATVNDWNDDVTLKLGPAYNLYTYNETVPDTNVQTGWTAVTSAATSLQSMKGYSLYFPRFIYNTQVDITGTYTHNASFTNNTLTNTASTIPFNKPSSDGWNFVGNPYPSTIDWKAATGWTKTNIDDAYYTWDGRTNKYVSFVNNVGSNGGTRYIGSMQGFFVKVTGASTGTLAMTNSVRTTSILYDVWRTEEEEIGDIFRLTAASGEFSDETVIRFKSDATPAFDSHLDAYKLLNGGSSPSLYSISGDIDYSINSLPNNVVEKTIPLSIITGFAGRYSFTADFSQFEGEQSMWLEDKLLGTLQNLREDNVYHVNLEKGSVEGRFFIQYRNQEAGTVTGNTGQSASAGIEITSYLQTVSVLFPSSNGNANIIVLDAFGKKVYEENNTDFSSGKIDLALPVSAGVYIVRVSTANATTSQQVYLTK